MIETLTLPGADRSILDLPRQCISPNSLDLPAGLPVATWGAILATVGNVGEGVQFWEGDAVLYGEAAYGEDHSQYLPTDAEHIKTLKVRRWVAQQIPPDRRRLGLSWSMHREVAGLEVEAQEHLLGLAEAEGWSTRRLREEITLLKGKVPRRAVDRNALVALSAGAIGRQWAQEDHQRVMEALGVE